MKTSIIRVLKILKIGVLFWPRNSQYLESINGIVNWGEKFNPIALEKMCYTRTGNSLWLVNHTTKKKCGHVASLIFSNRIRPNLETEKFPVGGAKPRATPKRGNMPFGLITSPSP